MAGFHFESSAATPDHIAPSSRSGRLVIWIAVIAFLCLSAAGALTLGVLALSVNDFKGPVAKSLGFASLFLLAVPLGIGPFLAGAAYLYYSSGGLVGLEKLDSPPMVMAITLNYMIQYWGFRIGVRKIKNDRHSALGGF